MRVVNCARELVCPRASGLIRWIFFPRYVTTFQKTLQGCVGGFVFALETSAKDCTVAQNHFTTKDKYPLPQQADAFKFLFKAHSFHNCEAVKRLCMTDRDVCAGIDFVSE